MKTDNLKAQSINFGMALKINKRAASRLQTKTMSTLLNIEDAGERLKDTKFFHVKIDNNLQVKLQNSNRRFLPLINTDEFSSSRIPDSKTLKVQLKDGRNYHIEKASDNTYQITTANGQEVDNLVDIDLISNLAKALDDATKDFEMSRKEATGIVKRIMNKYGESYLDTLRTILQK